MTSLATISATKISEQTLSKESYISLLAIQKPLTMATAATSPTLKKIVGSWGEETSVKLICAVLKLFNEGLNTSLQMSARQLFEYGQLFTETFPNETLKDLILCLKQVKMGKYGPIYNRVDGSVVSDFFRQYLAEKAAWWESVNRAYIGDQMRVNNFLNALPDESKEQIKKLTRKPPVRLEMHQAVSSDTSYARWLAENAQTIDFETLDDINRRADPAQNAEVLAIAKAELQRRAEESKGVTHQRARRFRAGRTPTLPQ